MPDPLTAYLIMSAIAGGAGAIGNSISGNKKQQQDFQLNQEQNALQESALNPFRGANAQNSALSAIDRQLHTTPGAITPGGPGGYNQLTSSKYTMSPETMQWLAELQRRIASGAGANPVITAGYQGHQPSSNLSGAASPGTSPAVSTNGSYWDPVSRSWTTPVRA